MSEVVELFSVVICVYINDNDTHFEQALESIIDKQSVKPHDVVIVGDGPISEGCRRVIDRFTEAYHFVSYFSLEKNMGHAFARQYGVNQTKTELVALMDSDDVSLPSRFEEQLRIFRENPSVDIVGGQIKEFISESMESAGLRKVELTDSQIKEDAKYRCPLNQVTVMFKKQSIIDVGGYIHWYHEEDYYLWIRMIECGKKFRNSEEILVNVRVDEKMYGRRGGLRYFLSEWRLQKYMLKQKMIPYSLYAINTLKRFIVQVMLTNNLRTYAFRRFTREKV